MATGGGVREEVSWQFAASWAAVGPWEHVLSGHLPPGSRKPEGWPRAVPAPAAETAPRGLLAAMTPGKERPYFSWLPKRSCLCRLSKSVLWAVLFVCRNTESIGEKISHGAAGQVAEGEGAGLRGVLSGLGHPAGAVTAGSGCRDGVCQRGPWNSAGRVSLRLRALPLLLGGPH